MTETRRRVVGATFNRPSPKPRGAVRVARRTIRFLPGEIRVPSNRAIRNGQVSRTNGGFVKQFAIRQTRLRIHCSVVLAISMLITSFAGYDAALAQEPSPGPAVSDDPDPTPIEEIVSMRSRDAKFFRNADGTFTAEFGQYIHYQTDEGNWAEVDLDFREEGNGHVMDRHDIAVHVSAAGVRAMDRKTGSGIQWLTPEPPSVSGRTARYSDGGLEWQYITSKSGLKLAAVVEKTRGPSEYEFRYQLVGPERQLIPGADGELLGEGFTIPRPVTIGADGVARQAGEWRLVRGNRIAFDYDDSALPSQAFPYELDPTTLFDVTASADSGGTSSGRGSFTTYPPSCGESYTTPWGGGGTTVEVERTRWTNDLCPKCYRLSNALFRWDTSVLPDTATINSAKVEIGTMNSGTSSSRNLTADWYSAWPIDCSDHSVSAQTSAMAGLPL
jgi:hypothetical protein